MKSERIFMAALVIFIAAFAVTGLSATEKSQSSISFPQNWETYKHIGSFVVLDSKSPLFGIHIFYMNEKGFGAFEKGTAYPDGTIIVGAVYELVTRPDGTFNQGKQRLFTYMQKNPEAKDTGGWSYAAFSPDAKMIEMDVKTGCFACHTQVKDSDYVFSKPYR
jgi:hypothetical protein